MTNGQIFKHNVIDTEPGQCKVLIFFTKEYCRIQLIRPSRMGLATHVFQRCQTTRRTMTCLSVVKHKDIDIFSYRRFHLIKLPFNRCKIRILAKLNRNVLVDILTKCFKSTYFQHFFGHPYLLTLSDYI